MNNKIIENTLEFLHRAYRSPIEVEAHLECVKALLELKNKQAKTEGKE